MANPNLHAHMFHTANPRSRVRAFEHMFVCGGCTQGGGGRGGDPGAVIIVVDKVRYCYRPFQLLLVVGTALMCF